MDQPSPPRRTHWRFLLRELFLFTIAASAILALVASHRWYGPLYLQPSVLSQEFGMPDQMRALAARCGHSPRALEDTGGTYTSSGQMVSRLISYRIALPDAARDRFLVELRRDALEMIRRGAHQPISDGSVPSDTGRPGFRVTYQGRHSRGHFVVRPIDLSSEKMDVMIFLHEHMER